MLCLLRWAHLASFLSIFFRWFSSPLTVQFIGFWNRTMVNVNILCHLVDAFIHKGNLKSARRGFPRVVFAYEAWLSRLMRVGIQWLLDDIFNSSSPCCCNCAGVGWVSSVSRQMNRGQLPVNSSQPSRRPRPGVRKVGWVTTSYDKTRSISEAPSWGLTPAIMSLFWGGKSRSCMFKSVKNHHLLGTFDD